MERAAPIFNLLTWWLMLHENIYHQWRKKLIEDTYVSWTRDLEYFARRQQLGNHWPRMSSYYESSFADHVTAIILRQTKEAG